MAEALAAWPPYQRATTVLIYLAFGSEVDLSELLEDDSKRLLVPRTHEAPEPHLSLHALRGAVLEPHPLGLRQPDADSPTVAPSEIDVALLPGLCFDRHGTRLGYGRGYFDRFLASLPPQVPRVGVTVDALVVERLPLEPHDAAVTHLATESAVTPVAAPGSPRGAPPSR